MDGLTILILTVSLLNFFLFICHVSGQSNVERVEFERHKSDAKNELEQWKGASRVKFTELDHAVSKAHYDAPKKYEVESLHSQVQKIWTHLDNLIKKAEEKDATKTG